jgi:hypothetical protein
MPAGVGDRVAAAPPGLAAVARRRKLLDRLGRALLKDGLPTLAARAWRRVVAVAELVNKERKYVKVSDLPLSTRLGMWRRGFLSESFTIYQLDRPVEAAKYLSDYQRHARFWELNRPFEFILDNKLAFWGLLRNFSPAIAEIDGLIHSGCFFPVVGDGDETRPVDITHLGKLGRPLVLKPLSASGGLGIAIYSNRDGRHHLNHVPCTADELRTALSGEDYVVCRFIEQAAYARRIFPDVANTIRVLTIYDSERREAFIAAAAHRFGAKSGGAVVDNWVQGGIAAGVDIAGGTLGVAYAFPRQGRLVPLAVHPDTGAAIEGVQIANWQRIREGIVALASQLPFLPHVGWDVIATDDGFAVIEGNNRPAVNIVQIGGPLLADPRTERFYRQRGVL